MTQGSNRVSNTTIMLNRIRQTQDNIHRAEMSTSESKKVSDITPEDIRKMSDIKTQLLLSEKYQKKAQYCEQKFSSALQAVDNISKKVSEMNNTIASAGNFDQGTRDLMNGQINATLALIKQNLQSTYANENLFDSQKQASNVKISASITINSTLNSNAITNIIKVFEKMQIEVNDHTVRTISNDLRTDFLSAQTAMGELLSDISQRKESATDANNANNTSIKSANVDWENFSKVDGHQIATYIANESRVAQSLLTNLYALINSPRAWGSRSR